MSAQYDGAVVGLNSRRIDYPAIDVDSRGGGCVQRSQCLTSTNRSVERDRTGAGVDRDGCWCEIGLTNVSEHRILAFLSSQKRSARPQIVPKSLVTKELAATFAIGI